MSSAPPPPPAAAAASSAAGTAVSSPALLPTAPSTRITRSSRRPSHVSSTSGLRPTRRMARSGPCRLNRRGLSSPARCLPCTPASPLHRLLLWPGPSNRRRRRLPYTPLCPRRRPLPRRTRCVRSHLLRLPPSTPQPALLLPMPPMPITAATHCTRRRTASRHTRVLPTGRILARARTRLRRPMGRPTRTTPRTCTHRLRRHLHQCPLRRHTWMPKLLWPRSPRHRFYSRTSFL